MSNPLLTNNLQPQLMIENIAAFTQKLLLLADDIGIDVSTLQADHIALRINDETLAKTLHNEWLSYGNEISSALINGRPIIVIQFHQPLQTERWSIECLELPYPAKGKLYPAEGWEHIEFVIPSQQITAEGYLAELKQRYPQLDDAWEQLDRRGISYKLSSPKGEGERLANPTVAFKRDGVCIKLHPHSLKRVVESEQLA